ncbi:PAS domain-containing protein [Halogeometricum sp. CBA1124]|nr:PAS domain-containing protein [Halogeometricum sp. CBA1124]
MYVKGVGRPRETVNEHRPVDDDVGILLVDDDPAFVEAAATFVGRHLQSANTYTAESPADARAFLESNASAVDCVVSDYEMHRETGLDLLETVRDAYPNLPFILFTGKGSEEVAGEAFRAGATDYLKKEMGTEQFEVLARRIEQAVTASRATREAARNRKLLDTALDAVEDVFYVFDASGQFLRWNDALADQTGYADEAIAEMHPTEFFDDGDAERVAEAIAAVLDGESVTIEATVRTKDGESRPYEFTGSLLEDEAGGPFGVCGVGRDRSNRARIHELEAVLDGLGVPTFAVAPDGTLGDVKGACDRLGVDDSHVGRPAWDVLPWDADSALATAVDETRATGRSRTVSVPLPDGDAVGATCLSSRAGVSVRVYLSEAPS